MPGRRGPLAAWRVATQYALAPTGDVPTPLAEATAAVRAAFEMAWDRYAYHPDDSPAYYAAMAASAVHELCAY